MVRYIRRNLFFLSSLIGVHLFTPVPLTLVILAICSGGAFVRVLLVGTVVTGFDVLAHLIFLQTRPLTISVKRWAI